MKIDWKFIFNRFAWYIAMFVIDIAACMFMHTVLLGITDMSYVNPISVLIALVIATTMYPGLLMVLPKRQK
jgi:hypothetical protein